jgi:hypothetical protein
LDKSWSFTPGSHPSYGSPFVVQGVIYPKGTLDPVCTPKPGKGAYGGLLPDGAPESPDQVISRWYCPGWFVGDGGPDNRGSDVALTWQDPLSVRERQRVGAGAVYWQGNPRPHAI